MDGVKFLTVLKSRRMTNVQVTLGSLESGL